MRKIIKIHRHGFVRERSDNMLSEFLPIILVKRLLLGTQTELTNHLFFCFQETEKNISSDKISIRLSLWCWLGLHRQARAVLLGPTNYEECLHRSE